MTAPPPPQTFAELQAWLAPQIGRGCENGECRAWASFIQEDHPTLYRAAYKVCLVRGRTEAEAVAAFLREMPVIFPGTDRFLVRSPLQTETHREFNTEVSETRIYFRAVRVPEWVLQARGNDE